MADEMTFDEWAKQASELDLRDANDFRHHYPIEIRVISVPLSELKERGMDILQDESSWALKTVCGCEPEFQHEFGDEDHRPPGWSESMDFDQLARDLGLAD